MTTGEIVESFVVSEGACDLSCMVNRMYVRCDDGLYSFRVDDTESVECLIEDSELRTYVVWSGNIYYKHLYSDEKKSELAESLGTDISFTDIGELYMADDGSDITQVTNDACEYTVFCSIDGIYLSNTKNDNDVLLLNIDGLENDTGDSSESSENATGNTYDAYCVAMDMTIDDLDGSASSGYEYNGLNLVDQDEDWLANDLNTEGTVEAGAMYRSVAMSFEGFYMGESFYSMWGSSVIPIVFGIEKPSTWDECKTYVDNASEFITDTDPKTAVMKKFQSLSCVEGEFDFDDG